MTKSEQDMFIRFENWINKGNGTSDFLINMSKLCFENSDYLRVSKFAEIYGISIPAANKETKDRIIDEIAGVRVVLKI